MAQRQKDGSYVRENGKKHSKRYLTSKRWKVNWKVTDVTFIVGISLKIWLSEFCVILIFNWND